MKNDVIMEDYDTLIAVCASFYEAFTGEDCDPTIAELLADGARDYYAANKEGNYYRAELALSSTLGYVNTELSEEEVEEYIEMFEDYLADY